VIRPRRFLAKRRDELVSSHYLFSNPSRCWLGLVGRDKLVPPLFTPIVLELPSRSMYRHMKPQIRLISALSLIALALFALTGCGLLSLHQFRSPAKDWQARTGQLMYRNSGMTVTGDVLVRFSKTGDFELTFSKGPGVNLFMIQQDATYAHVTSSLSHLSWSGKPEDAPKQLRGWLSLRQKLIASPNDKVVRQTLDSEKFVFRF